MLMVIKANPKLPAMTAQDVGRELYHRRYDVVQIIGDKHTLERIAWVFRRVPDMFALQFKYTSLIVRRAAAQADLQKAKKIRADVPVMVAY
jgi:hypothetical protein